MKKLTILIAMLMASSAWGETTRVYLECNKPNPTIEQTPTWLQIWSYTMTDGTFHRNVSTYEGNNVEDPTTKKVSTDDNYFRWDYANVLNRTTLKLSINNNRLFKLCIIYPYVEWKDRKNAYLDALDKKRKI